jgi:hypothetical protein
MLHQTVSLLLVSLLVLNLPLAARAAGRKGQSDARLKKVKMKAISIEPGTLVEVRLLNKEKLRGQIDEITDEGFVVRSTQEDKIQKRSVSFTELKSIKKVGSPKVPTWVLIGLGVAGAIAVVIAISCASNPYCFGG